MGGHTCALPISARSPAEVRDAGRTIAALASRNGVDLVQLNSPSLAADALFEMPVIGVCHACVASWWQAVRYGPMPDEFQWRTELLADGYARCDLLVAPTAAFAARRSHRDRKGTRLNSSHSCAARMQSSA